MNIDTPAAPDLAAAQTAGVQADIDTLPMRLITEAAAANGAKLYRLPDGSYTMSNPYDAQKTALDPRIEREWAMVQDAKRAYDEAKNQKKGGSLFSKLNPFKLDNILTGGASGVLDAAGLKGTWAERLSPSTPVSDLMKLLPENEKGEVVPFEGTKEEWLKQRMGTLSAEDPTLARNIGDYLDYSQQAQGQLFADFGLGTDWKAYFNQPQVKAAYDAAKAAGETWESPEAFAKSYYDNVGRGSGDFLPNLGGDEAQARRAVDLNMNLMQGGADIARTLEKQRLEDSLSLLPQFNALNLDAQKAAYLASLDAAKQGMANQMDLELAYRPKYTESELAAQKAAYLQSLDLGEMGTRRMSDLQMELLPGLNALSLDEQAKALAASTKAGREADPLAAALRDALLEQTAADLSMGGELNADQTRRTQENIRGAQVARGNVLGPSASVEEAMALTGYGDELVAKRQTAAMQALGTQPLLPNFKVQDTVNPLLPNFSAGQMPNVTPQFQATTTSGPNLSPMNVQKGNTWNVTDPSAGQFGANFAQSAWQTQVQDNRAKSGQMMELAGAGLGALGKGASFI